MKTYKVYAIRSVEISIEVKANSKQEAEKLAEDISWSSHSVTDGSDTTNILNGCTEEVTDEDS